MKQAVMVSPGKIIFQDVPVPPVGDDQIKVRMKRIGVCGSDIHVYHGLHPYTSYPVVQGHEVSAIVEETGRNVTRLKAGDMVTIQPQVVCGTCYPCTHGLYNDCESLKVMGFQTTGMASEYFVTEADKALKLPKEMSPDESAMIEPLAVAVHAVRRADGMNGKKVLVIGGGPIGNLVAQTAKAMGAVITAVSEVSAYRLKTAEDCSLATINPAKQDLKDGIRELFGSDGADIIFECVGSSATVDQAITCARKGSTIVLIGVAASSGPINMGFVQDHELSLIGSAMYRVEDYVAAIELVSQKKIALDKLITHRVPFKEYLSAYEIIETEKDKAMKVMIDFEE